MLDATFAVHVAVLDFFLACFTNGRDLNVKVEVLTRQRMVAIYNDGVAFDFLDGNHQRAALSLRLELHARLDALDALERIARHFLHQLFLNFAVTLFRGNFDVQFVASSAAFKLFFQARDDVARAVEIRQRLSAFGTV